MAYGLIMMAEANRFEHTHDSSALLRLRQAGIWLIQNSDLNENGIHGYGLADAWDAFGDGTENQAHQEYTITTAIALAGLVDWYLVDFNPDFRMSAKSTLLEIINPFLDTTFDSPIGIPAYSLSNNDLKYDVYNPAAYLAGQMMRSASIVEDSVLALKLEKKSRQIIETIMSRAIENDRTGIRWNYGTSINRPNDLVHASYIVEGLREYKLAGGIDSLDLEPIMNHFDDFYSDGRWYEYAQKKKQKGRINSRLWGLGMLMYTLSRNEEFTRIEQTLWPQLEEYHLGNGRFRFKENDDRQMIRQDAHLLLGLSYYVYR
jgi:hypothetical protein